MREPIAITGAGWVTPLGSDLAPAWRRLTAGESGIRCIRLFDASNFPVKIAAEIVDWGAGPEATFIESWQHYPRQTQFVLWAAQQAVEQAGLDAETLDPLRVGVSLGCGETFPKLPQFGSWIADSIEGGRFVPERFVQHVRQGSNGDSEQTYDLQTASTLLASLHQAQGSNTNWSAACVSGAQAICHAADLIENGQADVMFAGAAHSLIHPLGMSGLYRLGVLTEQNGDPAAAMRPFDRTRSGFVVGEGGAVVVLETLRHARRRDADVLAILSGWAATHDAFRITDAHPEGRGLATCIEQALRRAALDTDEIDYVNAHGTSTPLNDRVETAAIHRALGKAAYRTPVSSTKSMLGHCTTACGAVEFVAALLALQTGILPPTINYHTPDPGCDLDYVPNRAREKSCRNVLSTNLGFGGHNTALVISRPAP